MVDQRFPAKLNQKASSVGRLIKKDRYLEVKSAEESDIK
jgi:hypothetical protein